MGVNTSSDRRRVLKTIAASAATVSAVPTVSATRDGTRFEGVAYDPVTHEVYGDASAQFNDLHGDLRGNLRFGDEQVNMSKARQMDTGVAKGSVRSRHGFAETNDADRTTRHVRLTAVEDGLTGYVEDNNEKVAFSLVPKSRRQNNLRWLLGQTAAVSGGE